MSLDELCKALFVPPSPVGSNEIMGAARCYPHWKFSREKPCLSEFKMNIPVVMFGCTDLGVNWMNI